MATTLEIETKNSFFDFDKVKTQDITLEQLERTYKENNIQGQPLKGIYHYDLMHKVIDMCKAHGYNVNVMDMFAAHNKDRQNAGVVICEQLEEKYGKGAVEAHVLRRVYANIQITDFDDDENTTCLAVAFHQRGIQIGMGNMVKICRNQCMLSPELYAATYGEKGISERIEIPTLLATVDGWLGDAQKNIEHDRVRIERMKNQRVTIDETIKMIGELTEIRVRHDTTIKQIRKGGTYPLNQSQITDFTERMLMNYQTSDYVTLWDVYNNATEGYKAKQMDIPSLLPQNLACVDFLNERYNF